MTLDGPRVDPNKKRVYISLGIPMYNELEKGHLHETIDNALAVGFDEITILDDGSTDGSWVVLKEYAARYPHIKVFRNNKNSILNSGKNRWRFLVMEMAKNYPDWVVVRAADQIYSYKATIVGGDYFRKRLTECYHQGVEMVCMPLVHLWRSRTWYRNDHVWGRDLVQHSKRPIWRFHHNYSYRGRIGTGVHTGWHHPSYFGYGGKHRKLKTVNVNTSDSSAWGLVILHLGHTTHNKKVLKFRFSMEAAKIQTDVGRSILMPPPSQMPPIKQWLKYNGYKGFYEFRMDLRPAPDHWYAAPPIRNDTAPIPESMYYTILEYNPQRAKQYLNLYNKVFR